MSAPTELALQRAMASGAAPATTSGTDFAQLLMPNGLTPSTQAASDPSASASGSPSDPWLDGWKKAREAKANDNSPAAAAYVPVPAASPSQNTPPSQNAPTSGTSAAQAGAASTEAPAPTTSQAQALLAAAASGSQAAAAEPSALAPVGAAGLNARVAAGAANLMSQPNSALAGLWHHTGADDPSAAIGAASDGNAASAGDNTAPSGTGGPPVQTGLSAKANAALVTAVAGQAGNQAANDATAASSDLSAAAPASAGDGTIAAMPSLPGTSETSAASGAANVASPTSPGSTPLLPAFEQVAVNLTQAAKSGTDHIEIQLKPASLGAIDVKLNLSHDGRLTAVISADRSDTLNLLKQDASSLQQALRDAGLQADSGSLSFNLRGDAQSFAQNAPSSQTGTASGGDSPAATSTDDSPRLRRHAGALDIEV